MVFNLHGHLILSRVAAFCFTDENDAITVCVADADVGRLYGLALFRPVDLRPWFALQTSHIEFIILLRDAANINLSGGCFTINGTTRLTASPTLRVYVCFKCRGTRIFGGSEEETDHKLSVKTINLFKNLQRSFQSSPITSLTRTEC